jgi:uncharacterized membrane protein YfcA
MPVESLLFLAAAFLVVASLYTTVGHGGASGYLAVMALASMAPDVMRPTALALNILVASFTVYRFSNARFFSWQGLWPFLLGSVPMAAVGGSMSLGRGSYYAAVGAVLLLSSVYLTWRASTPTAMPERVLGVKRVPAVILGGVIGLLSGLTGVGGGIFLSPVLLMLKWAGPRTTAGISAPFILVNSVIALSANAMSVQQLPAELPWLGAAALAGALVGTWLGLEKLNQRGLLLVLALVMTLAGTKLLFLA